MTPIFIDLLEFTDICITDELPYCNDILEWTQYIPEVSHCFSKRSQLLSLYDIAISGITHFREICFN